jgi:hypothetical protein
MSAYTANCASPGVMEKDDRSVQVAYVGEDGDQQWLMMPGS